MAKPHPKWTEKAKQELLDLLESGETLTAIAAMSHMPSMATIIRWEDEQDEFGESITRAREVGYIKRAEDAVTRAQSCEDPQAGRLAFDADRWFLGKMHPKKFGDKIDVTSGNEKLKAAEANPVAIFSRLAAMAAEIDKGSEQE